jgi:hypothetical protein
VFSANKFKVLAWPSQLCWLIKLGLVVFFKGRQYDKFKDSFLKVANALLLTYNVDRL